MGLKLEDIEKKNLGEKSIEEFIENVSENSKFKLMVCIYFFISILVLTFKLIFWSWLVSSRILFLVIF